MAKKKYRVWGSITGQVDLGIVEASSKAEAVEIALNSEANQSPSLCHHCCDLVALDDECLTGEATLERSR